MYTPKLGSLFAVVCRREFPGRLMLEVYRRILKFVICLDGRTFEFIC